jgi:hypothetical protein
MNSRETSYKAYINSSDFDQSKQFISDFSSKRDNYYCNVDLHKPFDLLIYFEGIMGALLIVAFIYNYFKNRIPWS